MAKKKQIQDIRLADFPEEEGEQNGMNVRIYGETSYENQMAVLSHYLHNGGIEGNDIEAREQREEVVAAILEFLERKKSQQPNLDFEPTEELAWMAAENPAEYNLFADFFQSLIYNFQIFYDHAVLQQFNVYRFEEFSQCISYIHIRDASCETERSWICNGVCNSYLHRVKFRFIF